MHKPTRELERSYSLPRESGASSGNWRERHGNDEHSFGNKRHFPHFGESSRAGKSELHENVSYHKEGREAFYKKRKYNYNSQHSKKTRQMGFIYLKEILENDDLEGGIFKLSNDKAGFRELLESGEISNDMMVLLVKLLAKICACNFTESKLYLLQIALNSNFIDNLIKFISTLAIQSDRDKKTNSYFWKDPDEFCNDVSCISRTLNDLIPTTSCESMLKVLMAMKIYIPLIENYHSISISSVVKNDIDTLRAVIEKTCVEVESKHTLKETTQIPYVAQPPNDFRQISVYPNTMEVTTSEKPFLRPNVVKGPYQNVNHYLDVQFRLLREDFVAPLRQGICKYMGNPREKLDNIKIYNRIRFLNRQTVNEQNCYRIQYDFSSKKRTFQYENSRRFMYGALLCFTNDNFESLIFGKIAQRNVKDLERGHLIVGFDREISLPKNMYEQNYLMVESSVYFEPYYHVLNVLKTMQLDDFPMERYIIKVETDILPPQYLLRIDPVFYNIEDYSFWPLNWVDRTFYGLNHAQNQAFRAALTQEFSIIQGPPGTGKTFLGLKIAETLLRNKSAWYHKTPMLIICYTNHALDQFLEGLLEVTTNILRVGSQSKNEQLNNFNIKFKRRGVSNPTVRQIRHQVRGCLQNISNINETIKQIESNESIIDFSLFCEVVPQYSESWFLTAPNEDILNWLLGGRKPANYHMQRICSKEKNNIEIQNVPIVDNNEDDVLEELDDVFDGIPVTTTFRPLISLNGLNAKIKSLNFQLKLLEAKQKENLWNLRDMMENEQLLTELNVTTRKLRYLERQLQEGAQRKFLEEPQHIDFKNPHRMPLFARWQLYWFWLDQCKLKLIESRETISKEFQYIYKRYTELCSIEDVQIMKNHLVVGITTTSAARLRSSLKTLKSPIVIVEEAAEVLEAHITSSLTSQCQHLILIGDHQQLKPSTANFKIETKYHLGISLFERMVLNKLNCHTLNIQHRMRPEISCLIHPAIYPVLGDHESVLNRPPIVGVENCIYFIDHQEPEQACKDESKKNIHEAKFLINLAKYLILNGYDPEHITILASYLGQMFEMQREKNQYALLQNVRIIVLDNYQGEENDIILLSLVRSNAENKIGFLKNENRVCVALSRARNAFYIIGNMSQMCNNSDIWPKIKESLEKQNAIGPYLTLRCQNHKHKITEVKDADDFMNVAEGGCNLMCEVQVGCGHICTRLCHVEDRNHATYECREKCIKVLCTNAEHKCKKLCYEKCGPCTYKVERHLECGHVATIDCYIDPANYSCTVLVKTSLPCGHEAEKPCYKDPENFACPHPCDVQVQPCGHACTRLCHIRFDPDHLEYRCNKPCARTKIGCSLQDDDQKHPCSKLCFEECDECDVEIRKQRTSCSHMCNIPCKMNVNEIDCKKPCTKTLACGHKCKNKCHEPCGNCDVIVMKVVPDCNHEVKIKCSEAADRKFCKRKCPRLLACGHQCLEKCFDACTALCRALVQCSILGPCGHTISSISCGLKDTDDPAILLKQCKEKCNSKLKCGHVCTGTCGECFQSRIHQRCQEKCGVPLICNHECLVPCRQACKPCNRPCQYRCTHSKCTKKCGEICTKCPEACQRVCEHQKCHKKCGEICNIKPCYKPCTRLLKCKHPCVGYCGDPCPILCRVCNYKELTEIFLGNENKENAIYVMLTDCKHIFESNDLEKWLNLDSNEVKPKECPMCKTVITTTIRYNEYVKRSIMDIVNIKKQSYGGQKENDKERVKLLNEIERLQLKSGKLYKGSLQLKKSINKLKQRLLISRKQNGQDRRQSINKTDLNAVKSKIQMIEYMIDVYGEQEYEILPTDKSIMQISFILNAVMRDEDHITDQEISDITLEVGRLSRIVQLEKIKKSPSFMPAATKDEIKTKFEDILKMLDSPKKYCEDTDSILQAQLAELNKLVASSVVITEVEKKQIVSAMGFKKGHWFKCPNGHYYVIADCGGANQISKCNECGLPIGGQNHRLLPNQSHAPEIDNSLHPAWSEAANMQNYHF